MSSALYDSLLAYSFLFLSPVVDGLFGKDALQSVQMRYGDGSTERLKRMGWGCSLVPLVAATLLMPLHSFMPMVALLATFFAMSFEITMVGHSMDVLQRVGHWFSSPRQLGTEAPSALVPHYRELRNRLAVGWSLSLALTLAIAALFGPSIPGVLANAYGLLDRGSLLRALRSPFASLGLWLDIGFVVSVPILGLEMWRYVAPALTKRERKYGILIVSFVALLPLLAILLAAVYSRLVGLLLTDTIPLIGISNKLALITLLLISTAALKYAMALLRTNRLWQFYSTWGALFIALAIVLWPIWVFAGLAALSTLAGLVWLSHWIREAKRQTA